jgi:AraC-like DNA-binding protein
MIVFFATNALSLLTCLVLLVWNYLQSKRQPKDERLQYQKIISLRHLTINLTLGFTALLLITCFFITDNGRVELIPTTCILMCYFSFCVFVFMTTGIMGARYYRRFYVWVFLNQVPIALLVTNIFLLATGHYKKFFSYSDILLYIDKVPVYIYGRIFWLVLIVVCWLVLIGMLVHHCLGYHHQEKELKADDGLKKWRVKELHIIIAWGVMFQFKMVSFFFTSFFFHIFMAVALTALLVATCIVIRKELVIIRKSDDENTLSVLIPRRMTALLENERNNPLYSPNVTLEDIAGMLDVSRDELSDYIYHEKKASFSAWISDNRLVHIANQVAYTDRKITEIAISCGYNDTASLSRAFKRKYGVSPMEFREHHL